MIIGISAPHMPRCEHRGRLRAIEIPHSTPGWLSQMSGWFRSMTMHMYHTCMYSHSYSYSCSIMQGCRYTIHTVLCLHIALREVVCTHGMTMKKDKNGMSKILHVHLYHAALAYLCTPPACIGLNQNKACNGRSNAINTQVVPKRYAHCTLSCEIAISITCRVWSLSIALTCHGAAECFRISQHKRSESQQTATNRVTHLTTGQPLAKEGCTKQDPGAFACFIYYMFTSSWPRKNLPHLCTSACPKRTGLPGQDCGATASSCRPRPWQPCPDPALNWMARLPDMMEHQVRLHQN